jgi:hypothetical protein
MLKLVYTAEPVAPPPAPIIPIEEEPIIRTPFQAKVTSKGPNLYEMEATDLSHYLSCSLILEVEQNKKNNGEVICHFPEISAEQLNTFIWEDDTLYAITMIQFQMRVLKELFQFCINHYADRLVIYLNEDQAEDFEIYQDFLLYEDEIQTKETDMTKMVFPADIDTYEDWLDFMNQAILRFQQTLWQHQRKNPAIRHYLTSHPFAEGC